MCSGVNGGVRGEDARSKWNQVLQLLMRHWRRIHLLLQEPGPFIYSVTRARMTLLDLDTGGGPEACRSGAAE